MALAVTSATFAVGLSRWIEISGPVTHTGYFYSLDVCTDIAESKCKNALYDECNGTYGNTIIANGSKLKEDVVNGSLQYRCKASCTGYCKVRK